ncbi:MAG: hypothetical protein ACXWI5_02330 [Croceibacterium sp.]
MKTWQFWLVPVIILIAAIAAFLRHDSLVKYFTTSKVTPPVAGTFAKTVYSLPACDSSPDANTVSTVNIVLPDKFDGNKVDRRVNSGPKEPKDNPNTGENQSGFSPNGAGQTEPFDVFAPWNRTPPTTGYMLARVLLTKGNKLSFYQNGDFFGVGRNDASDSTLCGAAPALSGQNPGQGQAQEIATFYVDMVKLHAKGATGAVPFTIGVVGSSGAGSMTPILIDPKIINDGGGTRNNPGG